MDVSLCLCACHCYHIGSIEGWLLSYRVECRIGLILSYVLSSYPTISLASHITTRHTDIYPKHIITIIIMTSTITATTTTTTTTLLLLLLLDTRYPRKGWSGRSCTNRAKVVREECFPYEPCL